jgi:hypothetical protein
MDKGASELGVSELPKKNSISERLGVAAAAVSGAVLALVVLVLILMALGVQISLSRSSSPRPTTLPPAETSAPAYPWLADVNQVVKDLTAQAQTVEAFVDTYGIEGAKDYCRTGLDRMATYRTEASRVAIAAVGEPLNTMLDDYESAFRECVNGDWATAQEMLGHAEAKVDDLQRAVDRLSSH